jgi:hypothetical protein
MGSPCVRSRLTECLMPLLPLRDNGSKAPGVLAPERQPVDPGQ